MTDVTNNLMYEVLKGIQSTLNNHSEQFRIMNQRLSAIESHMAGFHKSVDVHQDEIHHLKIRLDRIEKRLDLADG